MQNLNFLFDIISWTLLLAGSFFIIIGSFGIYRFPEFWSRLQASSVIDSLGLYLILLGLGVQSGFTFVTVKLIIIGLFLFLTGPTSTHALANAAFISGLRPEEKLETNWYRKNEVNYRNFYWYNIILSTNFNCICDGKGSWVVRGSNVIGCF